MTDWWLWTAGASVLIAAVWAIRRRVRAGRPSSGDIWWADVPYARGQGSKLRPCLVLRRSRDGIVVLKITSQDKSHRRDHVLIPTRHWDQRASHDSYLNLGEPIVVRPAAFQRRAGRADVRTRLQVARFRGTRTRNPAGR
ncbi:type II toxin-antitoxin system PemK/MazF family toxin [Actinoplanes sp. NPDC049599]|uniref:type II toxin-antitoxin system PemK/MazF family toxin n=1 Tax=Actinoplanes sp. NPDC049599 TaxID=3363903 RepID=UPI00379F2C0E